ncbi:Uncharacterized protein dnl_52570 [Desulfonema limicola]|uniref:Uncharacterized protein n=1 Tax=Desulfonema limicola TaxID=45656 RepID=A0A975GIV7_9BACT|nr:hypothetical protein [Desulfonema limicola]QTA82871.1 Uncharacterized protein dnl_52570 [Desulfonema limicola]
MAKKTTVKSASKKKAVAKKKTTAKKKNTAANKPAAQEKGGTKTRSPQTAAKEVSVKDLIMKKFETWKPESIFKPAVDEQYLKGFTAPPFWEKEDNKLRQILTRKFDFKFSDVAAKPKIPTKELINKKFETWKPESIFKPAADEQYLKGFTAPPFWEKEDSKLRQILTRKFDFKFSDVAAKPKIPTKELINKKFETWKPGSIFKPAVDEQYLKGFTAPPFWEKEDSKLRQILTRKFDFDFAEEAEKKAAEEKAAAEKKAAEEKAAAEKKAAKERAAAEKKAAEEKAAAEKKAAEEKAAAEKKAAEERAAAEKKAAEEKAAAEKKAAEEKAAAEKKAAEEKAAAEKKAADPVRRAVKYLTLGMAILFTIIIASSYSNSSKYYLEPTNAGLQIWKGCFSPLGEKAVVFLTGLKAPESVKDVYTKEETYEIAYKYFIEKAEVLLSEKEIFSNIENIKSVLDKASCFALKSENKTAVDSKKAELNLRILLFKAADSISRGTKAGYEEALKYLNQAGKLDLNPNQASIVVKNIEMVNSLNKVQ